MYKILIPEDIAESGKNYLLEKGYSLKIGVSTDTETLKKELEYVDGVIVRNALYPKEVFQSAKKLKVIARHGTGVDNIAVAEAEKLGIWVVNGPLANIYAVAEYTMAMILSLSCNLFLSDRFTRDRDWSYRLIMTRNELAGATLGILGLGNVGRLVSEKAINGFGMKVLAYDPVKYKACDQYLPANNQSLLTNNLDEVLAGSDFITLHIPSTVQTKGMFNYELFHKMKRHSFFINCARGDLYIESDLARVLEEGYLRGAALDVYNQEPLRESRLYAMNNVILSQHSAGLSDQSKDKMSLYAAIGVDEVLRGNTPTWPVNHPSETRE